MSVFMVWVYILIFCMGVFGLFYVIFNVCLGLFMVVWCFSCYFVIYVCCVYVCLHGLDGYFKTVSG